MTWESCIDWIRRRQEGEESESEYIVKADDVSILQALAVAQGRQNDLSSPTKKGQMRQKEVDRGWGYYAPLKVRGDCKMRGK